MKKVKYYHKNSDVVVFKRVEKYDGSWSEFTYNERGDILTFKNSDGFWAEYTYDEKGNGLTCKTSDEFWSEHTYDENGNELTYKNSYGYYRIKSKDVSKEEFEQFINPKPCLGKKVVVDGVEYILS